MATEAPPAAPARPAPAPRKENVFTRKIGPLPMWGWVLIAVGLIGIYYLWSRNSQSQAATGTNASQVPQFVNQVYTSGVPPTAPAPAREPKCPKGMAWDPDSQKCIPEHRRRRGHHHHPHRHHRGRDMNSQEVSAPSGPVNQGGPIPIDTGPGSPNAVGGGGIGVFSNVPPTGM